MEELYKLRRGVIFDKYLYVYITSKKNNKIIILSEICEIF